MLERIDAETKSDISKIQMEQDVLVKEVSQKMEEIDNMINLERQKSEAEANYCKNKEELENKGREGGGEEGRKRGRKKGKIKKNN